jgi:hypothetical protein
MAPKYPIGVQSFAKLREDGYIYVDKTGYIANLIKEGNYFFLSRPRRFGKSLLLSTIEAFFQGRKELFEGLEISRMEHDWQPHPVFHMAMNANKCQTVRDLEATIESFLYYYEQLYGRNEPSDSLALRFGALIRSAYNKTGKRVAILIDEYDKPLLDSVGNKALQDDLRAILKGFYSNLKNGDQYIQFAMLTGVSRFGKLSIFSDLNNLQDISLSEKYSAICGMTIEEIRDNFDAGVRELAANNGMSVEDAYAELKKNYDGYHFSPLSPDMYNPFSLLNALSSGYIGAYWFSTGTPTFLVRMIRDMQIDLRDLEHIEEKLNNLMDASFDLSNAIPLMYQSGYLTIRSYDRRFGTVVLDYPNEEVEQGFLDMLMKIYTQSRSGRSEFDVRRFVLDVEAGRVDDFMTRLQALFSGYQYDQMDLGNLELHYRNVIYLVMKLMGFYTHAEMRTAAGRIDLLVKTPKYLYLFEFKVNESAQAAMDQINSRDYLLPFHADGRKIVKVGVNFDDTIRSIATPWIVEYE